VYPVHTEMISSIIGVIIISGGIFCIYRVLVFVIKKIFNLHSDEGKQNDTMILSKILGKRLYEHFISICCWIGASIIVLERVFTINRIFVIASVTATIILSSSLFVYRLIVYIATRSHEKH